MRRFKSTGEIVPHWVMVYLLLVQTGLYRLPQVHRVPRELVERDPMREPPVDLR
jgi:hypothetical protein